MLRARDLVRTYEGLTALDHVSLVAEPGELVGVLGPNGAGKTTLMRILAGVLPPDSGTVEIGGVRLDADPLEAKRHTGFAPEEPSLYEELSAAEQLALSASLRGLEPKPARARALGLLDRLGLAARADEPVGHYSHGMRKKLSFALALLHRPGLLLCDEALEGFDVMAAVAAKEELAALARAGTAVLFSSHVTETVERLCDRALILDHGRVVRGLERRDWGAEPGRSSPLEQIFLAATRPEPERTT
jgi:ABC-2 type transport system ATP-binding protein